MSVEDNPCELCGEPYAKGDEIATLNGGLAWGHRECLLRCVMGGIGHLQDHYHWCGEMNDPDGGLTYRQSALAVDQWVHQSYSVQP